jgi:hypothetical protein
LEALVRRIFIEINPFDMEFAKVGRYWDRKGENEIDLILVDEDSRTAHVVEVKRSLSRSKVSTIGSLNDFSIRYYFAGIDNQDIVIAGEDNKRFVL